MKSFREAAFLRPEYIESSGYYFPGWLYFFDGIMYYYIRRVFCKIKVREID